MKEFLSAHDLGDALQELCQLATSRCSFLVPSHAVALFDSERLAAALEQRPRIRCQVFFTSRAQKPGIEAANLQPFSRVPNLEVFEAEGEFNAIFCNEISSVLVPGMFHPLAASQGYSSQMGLRDYPDFEELEQRARVLYRRTPVFGKRLFCLRRVYQGSDTETYGLCFRA
ncbi:MAG: hypothetical protein ACON34_07595 [Flavobacteriales bacterium]